MPQAAEKGNSPYVRYNKAPYLYLFRNCAHSSKRTEHYTVGEEKKQWFTVRCCSRCNIIVDGPFS